MNVKQILGKHYERLKKERIVRSFLYGVAVCFSISIIFEFVYWMLGFGSVWLGLTIGIPIGITCGFLLYFCRYRLTEKTVARLIDRRGGLEERTVTMVELSDESSSIAKLQRDDTADSLARLSPKSLRLTPSVMSIVITAILLATSLFLGTLGFLASVGSIPYGKDILAQGVDGTFDVVYTTDGGGYIRGESDQRVGFGDSTSQVRAVADDGWKFVSWSDGYAIPERIDNDVSSNMVIKAVFEKIDSSDPDEDDDDSADDLPEGGVTDESGGGDSDEQGGENIKNDGQGDGGGKWQDRNQFIDGATYYRDYLEFYYQYATGIFDSDTEIPPEVIEFFETYFNGI